MKKKVIYLMISVFVLSLTLLPSNVKAEVEVTGLNEVVNEEIEIFKSADGYSEQVEELGKFDLSNYKESNDKVNVYLFRGNTCSHCFDSVVFFASIAEEYGEYFNLKAYEVWNNKDNSDIMNKVADELDDEVGGVPYIVVGNKSWNGYTDSYGEEIKEAIKSEYNKESSKRYDVIKKINTNGSSSNDILSLIIIIVVVAGLVAGIMTARKKA